MTKTQLKNLIDAATDRQPADLLITNCKIVNVLSGEISAGSVAVFDGKIIGMGNETYEAEKIFDASVGGDHECTTVAESIGIYDRGAIKIGARADFVLLDDLKNFSVDRLHMNLTGGNVDVIGIEPGGVVTKKIVAQVQHDSTGDFIFEPARDICKVAVSVAHDSHNIIAAGVSNDEIFSAVNALIKLEGGMVLVDGEEFKLKLDDLYAKAHEVLGISNSVEPVMTLTFMSLPVIPAIKLTARGLFDYATFGFAGIES